MVILTELGNGQDGHGMAFLSTGEKSYALSRRLRSGARTCTIGINRQCNPLATNPTKVWDRYAACLVTAGGGIYHDWHGREFVVEAGCVVHHFPGRFHHIERAAGGWEEYSLLLDRDLYLSMRDLGLVAEDSGVVRLLGLRAARDHFARLHRQLMHAPADDGAAAILAAGALLATLRPQTTSLAEPLAAAIDAACVELAADLAAEVPLAQWAEVAGVSYAHFRRRFQARVGVSPGAYRITARLEQARLLLRQHPLAVSEVAARCGYTDAFVFSRQYRRHFGIAPSHDQARHLQR